MPAELGLGAAPETSQTATASDAAVTVAVSEAVTIAAVGEWPADQEGYVFSVEPQGGAEEWLAQEWPELWEIGVRSIVMAPGTKYPEYEYPQILVRYIDGVRYEGTEEAPLGLTQGDDVPGEVMYVFGDMAGMAAVEHGEGKYRVVLFPSGKDKDLFRIEIRRSGQVNTVLSYAGLGYGEYHTYASTEEALADIRDGIPVGDGRVLDPAELSSIRFENYQNSGTDYAVDVRTWDVVPVFDLTG